MNLVQKLKRKTTGIQQYNTYRGQLHHIELEGEVSNRMMFEGKEYIIWCMNDYLGLMNNPKAKKTAAEASMQFGASYPHAARLTFGHTKFHDQLEEELSLFMKRESSFIINLGYPGISSMIDALTDRHDTIIYDQGVHACLIDGIRIHNGRSFAFKHNSIKHLEVQLKRATKLHNKDHGTMILIVDGIYSMYGEQAPLREIVELKKKYDFSLIVDDSHGFGVVGANGRGTPEAHGVEDEVDIYISSFTKAMGSIGGFVSGKKDIIEYLRYNTRSQIFSRAMTLPQVLTVLENLKCFNAEPERRLKLWENTNRFQNGLKDLDIFIGSPDSPITPIKIKASNQEGIKILYALRDLGVFSYIVTYPVVEKDSCLIRMVPTYNHTNEDIDITLDAFNKLKKLFPYAISNTPNIEIDEILKS